MVLYFTLLFCLFAATVDALCCQFLCDLSDTDADATATTVVVADDDVVIRAVRYGMYFSSKVR